VPLAGQMESGNARSTPEAEPAVSSAANVGEGFVIHEGQGEFSDSGLSIHLRSESLEPRLLTWMQGTSAVTRISLTTRATGGASGSVSEHPGLIRMCEPC
jgi:hypothetical protein